MMAIAMASCTDGRSDFCPPEPCSTCELGFTGPTPRPALAERVRIESTSANAGATVWLDDGTTRELAELPAVIELPANVRQLAVTTTHGALVLAFAPCD